MGTLDIFEVNQQLVSDISAALTLGDINHLQLNLDWISGLISTRKIDHDQLIIHLGAFSKAIEGLLGPDANIIINWLQNPFIGKI